MKKVFLALRLTFCATAALAQGTVIFMNRVPGIVVAPIYGPDPANPMEAITGNPPDGTPLGATVYGGPLLAGAGFTAQLWGGPDINSLAPAAGDNTEPFVVAGFWQTPPNYAVIPTVPLGSVAELQVRVWDNHGGTITTWSEAVATGDVLGESPVFSQALGSELPVTLYGLRSFNIHESPEPATLALMVLGAAALLALRGRGCPRHRR
jgi:hypothetical protein